MNRATVRVAVVGGGITGLAAAHRLQELAPTCEVVVFDGASQWGGVLGTQREHGCLIERSADMFITREPWALQLCQRIGFADQLINTNERDRRAFVVHRHRLVEVPEGFTLMSPARIGPMVRTPLLSWRGKLRLAAEWFIRKRRETGDESLRDFSVRRFGREAYERLIQPLIGGIYTADPTKLSMAATMRQFVEMEQRYGSVIRGTRNAGRAEPRTSDAATASGASRAPGPRDNGGVRDNLGAPGNGSARGNSGARGDSGARYGLFVAPREGMSSLIEAIVARLRPGSLRINTPVTAIHPLMLAADGGSRTSSSVGTGSNAGSHGSDSSYATAAASRSSQRPTVWMVTSGRADEPSRTEPFDAVILATPAPRSAELAAPWSEPLAAELRGIPVAGAAIVIGVYRRADIRHPLNGFGFVVPLAERMRILSGSFASVKFIGRAPDDLVVTRTFLGGACQPELLLLGDAELREAAHAELNELLGVSGPPVFGDVVRWDGAMPQYHVGHLERVDRIEALEAAQPGFALAGNAYRGVGIPFCVRSGEQAATRVVEQLRERLL
jgi:oxygen-dependent protoporphyrinogen oxidase